MSSKNVLLYYSSLAAWDLEPQAMSCRVHIWWWWWCCQVCNPWNWPSRFFCSLCLLVSESSLEAWLRMWPLTILYLVLCRQRCVIDQPAAFVVPPMMAGSAPDSVPDSWFSSCTPPPTHPGSLHLQFLLTVDRLMWPCVHVSLVCLHFAVGVGTWIVWCMHAFMHWFWCSFSFWTVNCFEPL